MIERGKVNESKTKLMSHMSSNKIEVEIKRHKYQTNNIKMQYL
jgi:hypothetical protein